MIQNTKIQKFYQVGISYHDLEKFFKGFPYKKEQKTEYLIDEPFFLMANDLIIKDISHNMESPNKLNVWDGFGIGKNELKHCSFFAWLLDPSGNHSHRELFLKYFLTDLKLNSFLKFIKYGYYSVVTEDQSAFGRVDIYICNNDFILIIEAKISADEQMDQILRYNKLLGFRSDSLGISREMCKTIFLTIDGRKASTGEADVNISWRKISRISKEYSRNCKNIFLSELLNQYSGFLKTITS